MTTPEDDRLLLDVREDLVRVDRVMTQVIADPVTTDEFIRDPSGVLARLGLHARTSREIHDRTNRVFYAVLTNAELMNYVANHFATFVAPDDDNSQIQRDALERGEIRHAATLDEAALNHAISDPEVVRQTYRLTLHDLNRRRLLLRVYTDDDLNDYIDRLTEAIVGRRSLRDMPVLEEWDAHYGVGKRQGVGWVEVSSYATADVAVEVGIFVTSYSVVAIDTVVKSQSEALSRAARGDPAGDVLMHANNFERP